MTIKAVYKDGVFRPTEPITLTDGTAVEVVVVPDPSKAAEFFRSISAMPLEPGGKEFTNREHDKILYGWDKK